MLALRSRNVLTLSAFAALFAALALGSYTRKSATWDEPQHLTAGYLALRYHDLRMDIEHPPLIRLWAALPLLFQRNISADVRLIDAVDPMQWVGIGQFYYARLFCYIHNDADRMLYAARFMIVLLGIVTGALLFCWAHELFGYWPALAVLVLFTVEPNLSAHATLVTTDLGVTCFMLGAVYFLWRVSQRLTTSNALGFIGFSLLACLSKFTALLLLPVALLLLAIPVLRRTPWPTRRTALTNRCKRLLAAALLLIGMGALTWIGIWASYAFRYEPSAAAGWVYQFDPPAEKDTRILQVARWFDRHRLLPNAYAQGFILGQLKAQQRSSYLAGHYSLHGWWYYFPVAFALKTPLTLQALALVGIAGMLIQWRRSWPAVLTLLVPLLAVLVAAMLSRLNIGLRHILPLYPYVLLLAAAGVATLVRRLWPVLVCIVIALAVAEWIWVYPHSLTFFNALAGGPRQGSRYLVDSNLDWGQDLKELKWWMEQQGVKQINLSYFGTADPAYYGIRCRHLLGAPFYVGNDISLPELPGYVAVSATNLRGVYLPEPLRGFYTPLLDRSPVAVPGNSIFVYWVEAPWW